MIDTHKKSSSNFFRVSAFISIKTFDANIQETRFFFLSFFLWVDFKIDTRKTLTLPRYKSLSLSLVEDIIKEKIYNITGASDFVRSFLFSLVITKMQHVSYSLSLSLRDYNSRDRSDPMRKHQSLIDPFWRTATSIHQFFFFSHSCASKRKKNNNNRLWFSWECICIYYNNAVYHQKAI